MTAELVGRVPRHDLDAEAAVLSALLLSPDAWPDVSSVLVPADFYSPANRRIYEAVAALSEASEPVDFMTVSSWLKARERLVEIGGNPYLIRITDAAPCVENLVAYAETVLACSRQRQAVALAQRVAAEGYGDVGDVDAWSQRVDGEFHALANGGSPTLVYEPMRTVIRDEIGRLEASFRDGIGARRVLTGLPSLDEKFSMMEGDLIVVGARPGMGKTAFVGGVMVHAVNPDLWPQHELAAWGDEAIAAAMHTQEMPRGQIALRCLCTEAKVNLASLRLGKVDADDWPALAAASQRLSTLPLWIDDKAGVTLDYLRKNIRALKRECERRSRGQETKETLRLVVVDYLQLMRMDGRKGATKSELVGDVTRGLKQLAKDEGLVVILLSQLNRGLESRDNKRPLMSDLRDSGEIEQDADAVLFLYRHGYYDKAYRQDIAEIIVGKQRGGETPRVVVRWTGAHTQFSTFSPSEEAELRFEAEQERTTKPQKGAQGW